MKGMIGEGARGMILLGVLGLAGVGAYGVGSILSSDAVGLLLGVIFGVLATLPGALLAYVAQNRRQGDRPESGHAPGHALDAKRDQPR